MKVLLINGSPHEKGCTYTALCQVSKALEAEGIETEIFHVGTQPIRGCMGCGGCAKNGNNRCVFQDSVNEALEKAESADAYVFGSPVHYAAASGAITSFLDRFFYAGKIHKFKPGAVVASARRAGTTATLDQLGKYLTISNMIMVGSQYWNMVHGNSPEQVLQDEEGMQTMTVLGRNMAWILKCIEAGKASGVNTPEHAPKTNTNFIR